MNDPNKKRTLSRKSLPFSAPMVLAAAVLSLSIGLWGCADAPASAGSEDDVNSVTADAASPASEETSGSATQEETESQSAAFFEETTDSAGQGAYQAYYDKLTELQAQYGDAAVITDYGDLRLSGLCFAELIDFNQDSQEELILAYCTDPAEEMPEYVLEVWEYDGGELKLAFTGDCWFSQEALASVKLAYYENQYFFAQPILNVDDFSLWWGEDPDIQWVEGTALFGCVNDSFAPVHYLLATYDSNYTESYRIDGEDLSWENLDSSAEYKQWLACCEALETYMLMEYSDEALLDNTAAALENTFTVLQAYLGIGS